MAFYSQGSRVPRSVDNLEKFNMAQMEKDLGAHRIVELPLAGDINPVFRAAKKEEIFHSGWAAIFDPTLAPDRGDEIGSGHSYRNGPNYQPTARVGRRGFALPNFNLLPPAPPPPPPPPIRSTLVARAPVFIPASHLAHTPAPTTEPVAPLPVPKLRQSILKVRPQREILPEEKEGSNSIRPQTHDSDIREVLHPSVYYPQMAEPSTPAQAAIEIKSSDMKLGNTTSQKASISKSDLNPTKRRDNPAVLKQVPHSLEEWTGDSSFTNKPSKVYKPLGMQNSIYADPSKSKSRLGTNSSIYADHPKSKDTTIKTQPKGSGLGIHDSIYADPPKSKGTRPVESQPKKSKLGANSSTCVEPPKPKDFTTETKPKVPGPVSNSTRPPSLRQNAFACSSSNNPLDAAEICSFPVIKFTSAGDDSLSIKRENSSQNTIDNQSNGDSSIYNNKKREILSQISAYQQQIDHLKDLIASAKSDIAKIDTEGIQLSLKIQTLCAQKKMLTGTISSACNSMARFIQLKNRLQDAIDTGSELVEYNCPKMKGNAFELVLDFPNGKRRITIPVTRVEVPVQEFMMKVLGDNLPKKEFAKIKAMQGQQFKVFMGTICKLYSLKMKHYIEALDHGVTPAV